MNDQRSAVRRHRPEYAASLRLPVLIAVFLFTLGACTDDKVETQRDLPATDKRVEPDAPGVHRAAKIQRVTEAEEFFELVHQCARCFKYEGALLDCWIEVEAMGKTTVLGEQLGQRIRTHREEEEEVERTFDKPSGRIVWVRRRENGMEVWDLGIFVTDDDGNGFGTWSVGMQPPEVGPGRENTFRSGRCGALSSGRENVLIFYDRIGDQPGQILRSAKLKCKIID